MSFSSSSGFSEGPRIITNSLFRRFSFKEIQLATNNFDENLEIGKGGFGKVYKAVVYIGDEKPTMIAVKRLNPDSEQGNKEFRAEIKMLSKLRHINLISLFGFCDENLEKMLLYEFMPHGTLSDHLYPKTNNSSSLNGASSSSSPPATPLSLERRLMICIGAARGLDYLHTGTGAKHRIIHRDVKSSNILLGGKWEAKISDFGLSKIGPANQSCTHVKTVVKGTRGYLDPDYFRTGLLTRKSDVYAFGVVLFEVLCGRPARDFKLDEEQQILADWAPHCVKQGTINEIIDPHLRGQISHECLKVFVEIADKCLQKDPDERPSMADIVTRLEFALASQKRTDSSTEEENTDISWIHRNWNKIGFSIEDENLDNVADPRGEIDDENIQLGDPQTSGQPVLPKEGNIIMSFSDPPKGIKPMTNKGYTGEGPSRRKKDRLSSSNGPLSPSSSWGHELTSTATSTTAPVQAHKSADVHFRPFSLDKILKATSDFNDDLFIGCGVCSAVYKGHNISQGHKMVAVKRFVAKNNESPALFQNEIIIHQRIRDHTHLVSLIGYCDEGREMILVYEYMRNNTLRHHLYRAGTGNNDHLSWKQRLQICIGAARGLNHLHTGTDKEAAIIHRGLNSSSIFLDDNWDPKVSGLGFSAKLVPNRTNLFERNSIVRSGGYVDPQYMLSGRLCTKSDVYSFGVLLLEVLCAQHPGNEATEEGYGRLRRSVRTSIRKRTLNRIIDPHLINGNEIVPECLVLYLSIALGCLLDVITDRPSMHDVVKRLEFAQNIQVRAEAKGPIPGLTMENVCREISLSVPSGLQSQYDTVQ